MDFSLQSGNQISLKRDDKPNVLTFMTRKVNGDIDYVNIVLMGISFATMLVAAALYFYNTSLAASVASKKTTLEQSQVQLKSLPINEIRSLYTKLKYANLLTRNYAYFETALTILGKSTENTVYYTKISLGNDKSGGFGLSLDGKADSYKNLAQQMNTFFSGEQLKYFSKPILGKFALDKETGKISFQFTSKINFKGITPVSDEVLLYGNKKPTDGGAVQASSSTTGINPAP